MDKFLVLPDRLTAENGAKAALCGEFTISQRHTCAACQGQGDFGNEDTGDAEDCEECCGCGSINHVQLVPWETIKDIYAGAVAHFREELGGEEGTAAEVARALLEWVDDIPAEVADSLPVMPGFSRDWADAVLAASPRAVPVYQRRAFYFNENDDTVEYWEEVDRSSYLHTHPSQRRTLHLMADTVQSTSL